MSSGVTFFGFGISNENHPTRIKAHVFRGSKLPEFVEPQVRVGLAKPMREQNAPPFHSGILVNGDELKPEKAYAPGSEGVERSTLDLSQGVLEVIWPADSEGKRCLIEVSESDIGCGRSGRLLVGLVHVPKPEDQVWL